MGLICVYTIYIYTQVNMYIYIYIRVYIYICMYVCYVMLCY